MATSLHPTLPSSSSEPTSSPQYGLVQTTSVSSSPPSTNSPPPTSASSSGLNGSDSRIKSGSGNGNGIGGAEPNKAEAFSLTRNASTASSRSNTTSESTSSSLVAVPIRPPPIQTRTAATSQAQLPSPGVDVASHSSLIDSRNPHSHLSQHGYFSPLQGHPPKSDVNEKGYPSGAESSSYEHKYHPGGVNSTSGTYGGGGGYDWDSHDQGGAYYGGRGFMRNGPRMGRQNTAPLLPSIITSSSSPSLAEIDRPLSPIAPPARPRTTAPGTVISPTTPRALRLPLPASNSRCEPPMAVITSSPTQPRVTISLDPTEAMPPPSPISPVRSRPSSGSTSNSPVMRSGYFDKGKDRTLSVDGVPEGMVVRSHAATRTRSASADRERRQSQTSTSSSSPKPKPSAKDFIFGEEIGRGSYSTVIKAKLHPDSKAFPQSTPEREYAIKIMNQAHLVQEKKIKYALSERDVLVILSHPRQASPTSRSHKRGVSSSSSVSHPLYSGTVNSATATKRKSNNSVVSSSAGGGASLVPGSKGRDSIGASASWTIPAASSPTPIPGSTGRELLSVVTALSDSSSSAGSSIMNPLSPVLAAGRRPSRSAELPERVIERVEAEDAMDNRNLAIAVRGHDGTLTPPRVISRPPSPVKEEPSTPEYQVVGGGCGDSGGGDDSGSQRLGSVTRARTCSAQSRAESNNGTGDQDNSIHLSPESAASQVDMQQASSPMSTIDRERGDRVKNFGVRRTSLAPSERSVKSNSATIAPFGVGHPGIIRLYCTFADAFSLFYVLDLARNGELASWIRKFGSLDIDSARYYSAQIVDTIEFVHERDVIHRDLKPENILLDDDMRIKLTDFGSAKNLKDKKKKEHGETSKRSFVGSADYVSPEMLRSEQATFAADIWALGVIIYDLIVGKPPFRSATEYLTFQKILQRQLTFPEGFDPEARDLVEVCLNLDPTQRPTATEIKLHPFFSSIEWSILWSSPAPVIRTGLTPPVKTLANVDLNSDVWAVFDDEVSDGGFEYDDDDGDREGKGGAGAVAVAGGTEASGRPGQSGQGSGSYHGGYENLSPDSTRLHQQLTYDRLQAKNAIEAVDHPGIQFPSRQTTPGFMSLTDPDSDLDPPRRTWLDSHPSSSLASSTQTTTTSGNQSHGLGSVGYGSHRKGRGLSSSSSSSGRLSGLLESIGINPPFSSGGIGAGMRGSPSRNSRVSDRSDDRDRLDIVRGIHSRAQTPDSADKWSSVLLGNERVILSTPISTRPIPTVPLPSFLLPAPKRRQLILTDLPRLIAVKEDSAPGSDSPSTSNPSLNGNPNIINVPTNGGVGGAGLKVKIECVFLARSSVRSGGSIGQGQGHGSEAQGRDDGSGGGVNCVLDVQEKGPKGFTVQTISQTHLFIADSSEVRDSWVQALRRIVPA